jgi:hypothetical protein
MSDALHFDEDALLAQARAETGLSDFGDDSFRDPLRRLLAALATEANLNAAGRAAQHGRILGSLKTRLISEDTFRRIPEILEQKLAAPVFILGPTRSGTTRLHRLVSSDPRHHTVLWWENRAPSPYPGTDWRRDDPRIEDAREEVRATLAAVPQLAAVHPWDAEGPDEEIMLMEHAFLSQVPESGVNIPSYRSWLDAADLVESYRYLSRMLRFLQWQKRERGEVGERWMLKTPMHLGYLDDVFEVFPDARVIQTHRDPLTTVPSAASMYSALWELNTDEVDRREVGRQIQGRLAFGMRRCLASRDRLPAERFFDVWYEDVNVNAMEVVEGLYDWLGAPLVPEARSAMQTWLIDNARDKRPPHHYTLDEFGYTREGLEEAFREYRERFILSRDR